jgi:hypothetical protein
MEQFKQYGHLNTKTDGSQNFYHIYGHPSVVSYCDGKEKQPVFELTFEEHQNQDINAEPIEYWGWVDFQHENKVNMIYAKRFLLEMCFPNINLSIERGQGKAVKFNLVSYKQV